MSSDALRGHFERQEPDLRPEVVALLLDVRYDHKVADRDMFKRADKVIDTVLAPVIALAAELEKDGNQVYAWDVAERLRRITGGTR